MRTIDTKGIELTTEQYCSSMLMDVHDFRSANVKACLRVRLDVLAHSLTACFKTPAKVLQHDRVLATYPTTWWDAVKARLGWKHERTEVLLNEHLIFPHVDVPMEGKLRHRLVYIEPRYTRQFYDAEAPIES